MRNFSISSWLRIKLMLWITPAILCFAGCGGSGEMEKLQLENDSLVERQFQNDSLMRDLVRTFVAIDSNMKAIQEKEKNVDREIAGQKLDKAAKDSVIKYMKEIDDLSANNKALVDKLETKLHAHQANVPGMKKIISSLNSTNEHKVEEVNELKSKLTTINKDFKDLFEEYVVTEATKMELNERNSQLDERNLALSESNTKLLKKLNTAWYAMGTKADLKRKGLIDSKGVLDAMFDRNISKTVDRSAFKEIDMRSFNVLTLGVKKATLVTPHPPGSFTIKGDKKSAEKLIINQPEEFWSLSKYLLIEIEY